jgi:hypothetical protein
MPMTLIADEPTPAALAEAEAAVRAGIVTDWLTADSQGDRLGALAAEYLARQVDASTQDGPRLMDEIAALRQLSAA